MSAASTLQHRQAGSPASYSNSRINAPSTTTKLRRRHIQRSSTSPLEQTGASLSPLVAESRLRRNSTFSDTVSEARHSIKSSTDDLLLPRPNHNDAGSSSANSDSIWQSSPLVLALLPALAGVLFHNGTAFCTDITLLALVAVFLNWSIRLPWDWYYSAQQSAEVEQGSRHLDLDGIAEEAAEDDDTASASKDTSQHNDTVSPHHPVPSDQVQKAKRELHLNELAALASCFLLPLVGTWLLHTIRSQLSRPSEGLVSNYNLTIFVLAAEIRPFSHLLKLVQTRTLYLQRVVQSHQQQSDEASAVASSLSELSKRLEELESTVVQVTSQQEISRELVNTSPRAGQDLDQDTHELLISDMQKIIQPEIDTLQRAIRRQEKRITTTSFETGSRLRELERRTHGLGSQVDSIHKDRSQHLISRLSHVVWATFINMPFQTLRIMVAHTIRIVTWPLHILSRLLESKKSRSRQNSGYSKTL